MGGGDPNPALLWELLVWVAGRAWRATWSCDIAGSPLWGWQACPGILLVDGANYQVLSPPGFRPSDKHLWRSVCCPFLSCPLWALLNMTALPAPVLLMRRLRSVEAKVLACGLSAQERESWKGHPGRSSEACMPPPCLWPGQGILGL